MQNCRIWAGVALALACFASGQQPAAKGKDDQGKQSSSAYSKPSLKDLLESKVRAEWEAFKKKDKKAYGDLLADDFIAVETDNEGTRTKQRAVREVEQGLVHDYLLAFFKVTPLGPDAAFVTYECSIQFPPKSQVRFERVYVSEVWVKRDGQWKARHYQETRVR